MLRWVLLFYGQSYLASKNVILCFVLDNLALDPGVHETQICIYERLSVETFPELVVEDLLHSTRTAPTNAKR
jgi:hypothetical protein